MDTQCNGDKMNKREFVYELIREAIIGANTANAIEKYLNSLPDDDETVMCEDCGNWKSNCQCNLVDDLTEDTRSKRLISKEQMENLKQYREQDTRDEKLYTVSKNQMKKIVRFDFVDDVYLLLFEWQQDYYDGSEYAQGVKDGIRKALVVLGEERQKDMISGAILGNRSFESIRPKKERKNDTRRTDI